VNEHETGDDALDREALGEDEAADVARDFWTMLRWQTSGPTSVYLSNRMADGSLVHDVQAHDGQMYGSMMRNLMRNLWLPVRVPWEGRNR
jgi:hypothetical protein